MEWKQLLCALRQQMPEGASEKETEPEDETLQWGTLIIDSVELDEYDSDFLAISSSQAFRRLQDKTQVFPLDKSDFVRTRLTHSMEVSTVGRFLMRMICNKPEMLAEMFEIHGQRLATIVACAGLLHDTGNPPFGHYGEEVIRDWFRRKFQDESFTFNGEPVGALLDAADRRMRADFENFEGNAQGLRILSKAGLRPGSHDINLTFAVMNTLIKYPNPSTDFDRSSPDVKRHKMGYYYAEREIMDRICTATGTKVGGQYLRHPLVYVMEAADDIAYATADLADSLKKGRFTVTEFIDYYEKESNKVIDRALEDFIARYESDEALHAKLKEYYRIHLAMRAKSRIDYNFLDREDIKSMDRQRVALFRTQAEEAVLDELEDVKKKARAARNKLNPLRKSIESARNAAKQAAGQGESVLRGSLKHSDTPETEFAIFENWLEDMRLWLMDGATQTFVENYDAIMEGSFPGELCDGNESSAALRIMKKAMAAFVYDAHELISLELSAKKIVESLLEDFIRAVMYADEPNEAEHMTTIDDRFVHMIPDNFKMDYLAAKEKVEERFRDGMQSRADADAEELYLRFLMVTDFISGMTDSYARNLYRITNGME